MDEVTLLGPLLAPLSSRHDIGTNRPADGGFCPLKRSEDFRIGKMVRNDHKIAVASGRVGALGHRTIDEGNLDLIAKRSEGASQGFGQTDGLLYQPVKLGEDRRLAIGLVAPLPAHWGNGHETDSRQTGKFTMHCACADAGKSDQFRCGKASVGLRKENAQNSLLPSGEQRIC